MKIFLNWVAISGLQKEAKNFIVINLINKNWISDIFNQNWNSVFFWILFPFHFLMQMYNKSLYEKIAKNLILNEIDWRNDINFDWCYVLYIVIYDKQKRKTTNWINSKNFISFKWNPNIYTFDLHMNFFNWHL